MSLQVSLFEVFKRPLMPKLFPEQEAYKEAQAFTSSSGVLHSGNVARAITTLL